ncbi:hypothetical protein ILYODFUR_032151 [Ilyodon furcidens]|uniref:Uncharacterized protein n=1 Tax=Ilyodon furcidens TaxID=33524 RepID=A0ABV0SSM2_9TELE
MVTLCKNNASTRPRVTLRFTQKNQVFYGARVEPEFVLWNLFFVGGNTRHRFKITFGNRNRLQPTGGKGCLFHCQPLRETLVNAKAVGTNYRSARADRNNHAVTPTATVCIQMIYPQRRWKSNIMIRICRSAMKVLWTPAD